MDTKKEETKITQPVIKVTHVVVTPEGRTEYELTGKELEEWKKEHGLYVEGDNK